MEKNIFFICYNINNYENVLKYIQNKLCYGIIILNSFDKENFIRELFKFNRNIRFTTNNNLKSVIDNIHVPEINYIFSDSALYEMNNLELNSNYILSSVIYNYSNYELYSDIIINNFYHYKNKNFNIENISYTKIYYPIIPDTPDIVDKQWGYYIPFIKKVDFINSCDYMISGFMFLQNIIIVDNEKDADYIIIHPEQPLLNFKTNKKIIIVDYFDNDIQMSKVIKMNTNNIMKLSPFLYFKRSCINITTMEYISYDMSYIPINYAVKHEYIDRNININNKDIDIICFFNNINTINTIDIKTKITRNNIGAYINYFSKKHSQYNIKIGRVDNKNKNKYAFNREYFDLIKRSKIIVSCNPNNWIGDFRLFEALAGNSLVFVDNMPTLKDIFIHQKHIIYYNNYQDLEENLLFYLKNNNERIEIANNSYTSALNEHTYKHRANFILHEIYNKENKLL